MLSSDAVAPASDARRCAVHYAAWMAIPLALAVQAWVHRFDMVNMDGVSYLELAWAWREGRWADAINGYWSPLYPLWIAALLAVIEPSPYWEYPTLHLANLLAALMALAAFAYLLSGMLRARAGEAVGMPPSTFAAVGYGLFAWSALMPLAAWMESPDMLLAAFVYAAFGALVRLRSRADAFPTWATFGAALGLGYLTKAAMMPIALGFGGAAALIPGRRPARLTVALAAFLAVAGPWLIALSSAKGRLTFGDAGRLNYVWFVNRSADWPNRWPPHWPHFDGDEKNGASVSAAARLNDDPAVYGFATSTPATYPMWYEPSRYYDGVRAAWDLRDQLRRLLLSAADCYRLSTINPYNLDLFNPLPAVAAILIALVVLLRAMGISPLIGTVWPLWIPPLAALSIYSAVYVEPRYLGAFLVIACLLAVDALRPPAGPVTNQALRAGGIAAALVVSASAVAAVWIEAYGPTRRALRGEPDVAPRHWARAVRMRDAGLQPATTIGYAGSAQVGSRWAHLGRVRIVAEVPLRDAWKLGTSEAARAAVSTAFRSAGAEWAVWDSANVPAPDGWSRVDGTPYLIRRLR